MNPGPMPGLMPMPGNDPGLAGIPAELVPYLATLDELAHAEQPLPEREHLLHVPFFFHQMTGVRGTPVFQSAPLITGVGCDQPGAAPAPSPTANSAPPLRPGTGWARVCVSRTRQAQPFGILSGGPVCGPLV